MPIDPIVVPLVELAAEAGWPVMFQTGTYVQSDVLAVAEVARAYPKTPFILGSGGFADMWFDVPGAMRDVPNLWLETSQTLGNGIRAILNAVGSERIVFGSGEPRNRFGAVLKKMERLDLAHDTQRAIFDENARRVFHLS
jgi:predicted TIM-barrel fold metal-dependent hydrolase